MKIKHVGLICSEEETADKFYKDVLGLIKMEPRILPAALSKDIFNIDSELKMINYLNDEIHFEIFIHDQVINTSEIIEHICLEVNDRKNFISRCESLGVRINKIQKEKKTIVFIWDFDNHFFEIKEK